MTLKDKLMEWAALCSMAISQRNENMALLAEDKERELIEGPKDISVMSNDDVNYREEEIVRLNSIVKNTLACLNLTVMTTQKVSRGQRDAWCTLGVNAQDLQRSLDKLVNRLNEVL